MKTPIPVPVWASDRYVDEQVYNLPIWLSSLVTAAFSVFPSVRMHSQTIEAFSAACSYLEVRDFRRADIMVFNTVRMLRTSMATRRTAQARTINSLLYEQAAEGFLEVITGMARQPDLKPRDRDRLNFRRTRIIEMLECFPR